MPRHTLELPKPDHYHIPVTQRRPSLPRNLRDVWVIDNYRVRSWYYRAAPAPGDVVRYMDGTCTFVSAVTATRIMLDNSLSMRRPYQVARMWSWIQPRLVTLFGLGMARRPKAPKYAPNQVTLYV